MIRSYTKLFLFVLVALFAGHAANAQCHMELRPTGAITDIYPSHGAPVGQGSKTLNATCEGNCTGAACPAKAQSGDATSHYYFCPECGAGSGEPNCCHAIVRVTSAEGGTAYFADVKGLCGGTCGSGTCQLALQGATTFYYIGQCK